MHLLNSLPFATLGFAIRGHLRTSKSDIRRTYFRLGVGGQRQLLLSSDIDMLRFGLSRPLILFVHSMKMIALFRSSFYAVT